jgi:tetratricopeptide (TPR) repeat protein
METLAWAARVDRFHLNLNGCLQKSDWVIELARRVDQPLAEMQAHRLAANMLTTRGDLGAAGSHASAMLGLAERLDDHYWRVTALVANERQARLQGRFPAAREFSDRGLELSPMDPRLLAPRALLEYELGDFAEGETYLNRFLEAVRMAGPGTTSEYATPSIVIPLITRIRPVDPTTLNNAEGLAREILSSSSVTPLVVQVARVGLALLAVLGKDAAAAREQYAALAQVARGTISPTGAAVVADPLLGLLAQTTGNLEQAVTHFVEALSFCRRAGCRPELARTCYHYADALLERNASGDQGRARSLLDEALSLSRELGMRPLMERVLSRRETLRT